MLQHVPEDVRFLHYVGVFFIVVAPASCGVALFLAWWT